MSVDYSIFTINQHIGVILPSFSVLHIILNAVRDNEFNAPNIIEVKGIFTSMIPNFNYYFDFKKDIERKVKVFECGA